MKRYFSLWDFLRESLIPPFLDMAPSAGRDYPVALGILVISSVLALRGNIISDICYVLVDPRIEFR